ncbi:MAG: YbjN domain-containing protein [Moraxella sp.]|uniref:YbjN domain-containing protein n=1 Tax=Moraxella sp. TaxID=479 RepID=UPI0026DC886E|nr:YbjN domain-containing protein [Moraxella sp.]MDO4450161.1 YbjN domain-containing protein [Moraxella sp.]
MFKKIKSLFAKPQTDNQTKSELANTGTRDVRPKNEGVSATKNAHPITSQIMTWLDKQDWKYDHRTPSEGHIHHLIMGFSDRENDWTCVFRINEENQLVTIFGILENSVPVSHYTAMLMELAKMNMNVGFGGIEFDPTDGEVRAKVAFDVEFSPLSDKALGCYLQAVAGLTEVARNIMHIVLADDEPSQFAGDYIDVGDEVRAVVDDEKRTFFLPTQTTQ